MSLQILIEDAIATGAGDAVESHLPKRTVQASVVASAGAGSATVLVQGSNNKTDWLTLATISLSGTPGESDGAALESPWKWIRAECTAIAGTDSTLNVIMETQP